MELTKVLLTNYLPYAKGTIIGRAIPSIDGLKPAQRRILYTMHNMGLDKEDKEKAKSARIVGDTMKIHPHGDGAIYETMVRMTVGNEALNVPYIESKGNFGKAYSKNISYAAYRYTEAKLAPICKYMFDGINENAVDMIDNFDGTMKEPTLLPVKFPSIIVNTSSGIAVGTSSDIPSFPLVNACQAARGIADNSIQDIGELMDILGVPEFSTGGYVHASREDLIQLGKTGKASFIVSGVVTTYPNRIEIEEIPYGTTSEAISEAIEEAMKNGELKEVSNVDNETDKNGLKLTVEVKRGYNSSEVLTKLCRLTNLRMPMSFITRVIIGDECRELGIYELLQEWLKFRLATILRINEYRKGKFTEKEYLLRAWEAVKDDIQNLAKTVSGKTEEESKAIIMEKYSLSGEQADYLLDNKIRKLSTDNLVAKLKELEDVRKSLKTAIDLVNSEDLRRKLVISELDEIIKSYGTTRKTHQAPPIVITNTKNIKPVIDDTLVSVVITKSGYIKRLVTIRDNANFELPDGEEIKYRFAIKNNEYLLVFTYSGDCYKILVDSIDASKGGLKDKLVNMLQLKSGKDILYIDKAEDYSGYFNLVYPNGRGVRVYYNKVSGNRQKYKSLYSEGEYGKLWITKAEKFFMITARRKAAYCDLSLLGALSNRVAFKVARVGSNDSIFGLQPVENVPDINAIDVDRYRKDYTVSIGKDVLWYGADGSKKDESVKGNTKVDNTEDSNDTADNTEK